MPAFDAGLALLACASALTGHWMPLAVAALSSVGLAALYLALGLLVPHGMGMGDVKWAAVVGLFLGFLGFLGWPAVVSGTLAAFAVASLFLAVSRTRPGPRAGAVPMAPFMSAGALCAILLVR